MAAARYGRTPSGVPGHAAVVLEAHREWRDDIALRASAVRAYLEGCGLASAERVLREMFGAAEAAQRSRRQSGKKERPDSATLDAWMLENVKPSAKRDPTIPIAATPPARRGERLSPHGSGFPKIGG